MSIRTYRVSNFLIWTCVASYVEFCLFEKLWVESFAFLAWFMDCQQGGEVWAWNGLLEAFRRFSGGFEPFSGLWCAPVWLVEVTGLTGQSAGPVHMLSTNLTGGCDRSDRWELSSCSCPVSSGVLHAFVQGELHWFRGSLHVCRGSSLWILELWFGGLCSLLKHSFVPDVSSRCPCLRGPRLVFFKWSCYLPLFGFPSLVGVSFYWFICFFFSLLLLNVGVVNAVINGEIEDHVWFKDWWMVASLCDEWLTTLCGLILG
jgi:hypothetical protein